ncbi:unnamed protein product [Schistosoma curassoni]|uniref:Ovule protein n=1 Tax=Schistosoma curassoni TaxID=6186 RepID=A0A183JLM0_9TREM|nr:unnamed protein product [Schistosoma curassoni]
MYHHHSLSTFDIFFSQTVIKTSILHVLRLTVFKPAIQPANCQLIKLCSCFPFQLGIFLQDATTICYVFLDSRVPVSSTTLLQHSHTEVWYNGVFQICKISK